MASSLSVHFVAMQNMYLTRQLTCQLPAQCFLNTDVETRQEHESFSLEKPLIYQAHTEESLSVPNRWKLSSIVVVLHVSWRVRKSTQKIILLAARMQTYIFHKVGNISKTATHTNFRKSVFSCSSAEAVCWINRKTGEKVSQGQSQSSQLKRGIISHDSKIPESGAESRGLFKMAPMKITVN